MTVWWNLAQLNIARPRAPLDHPLMAEFMANLARINALGDASPGFVWRLQDDSGNATELAQPFGAEIIVNMTVWESMEALRGFVFRSEHTGFLRRRAEWFHRLDGPATVLWWIEVAHRPTLLEAKQRLDRLVEFGPTPEAFTFARPFAVDGLPVQRAAAG
jgi:Domain of unknown function (DUF3291)